MKTALIGSNLSTAQKKFLKHKEGHLEALKDKRLKGLLLVLEGGI